MRLEFNSPVARTFSKIYPKIENPEDRAGRDPSNPSKGQKHEAERKTHTVNDFEGIFA